jgi:hypothetical protein
VLADAFLRVKSARVAGILALCSIARTELILVARHRFEG